MTACWANDVTWSSEGGVLLVKRRDAVQAQEVSDKLLAEGMEICSTDFMPAEQQEQLIAFMVPAGSDISFEAAVPGTEGIYGPSKYTSNHGMRPGTWADFRFCIFSGPDVPQQQLGIADNTRFAPTMAQILGVETPWQATSVLEQPPEIHDFSEYLLQSR